MSVGVRTRLTAVYSIGQQFWGTPSICTFWRFSFPSCSLCVTDKPTSSSNNMSHKMIRGRDPRVFRYFTVLCNNCGQHERSLGDINVHRMECGYASFAMTCGCCSQVYTNWRALTIHLNESLSHKRLPAPSFSITTSTIQTATSRTPLPTSASPSPSQYLVLPTSLSSSHTPLQPPCSSPVLLGTPITSLPSARTFVHPSPLLPHSELFFMSPPLNVRLLQTPQGTNHNPSTAVTILPSPTMPPSTAAVPSSQISPMPTSPSSSTSGLITEILHLRSLLSFHLQLFGTTLDDLLSLPPDCLPPVNPQSFPFRAASTSVFWPDTLSNWNTMSAEEYYTALRDYIATSTTSLPPSTH